MSNYGGRKYLIYRSLELIALVLLFFWMFAPFSGLVLWSIAIKWYWPHVLPQEIGLDYWLEALGIRKGLAITGAVSIIDALQTSIFIALVVVALSMIITLPASYVLARYKIPFKSLIFFLFLMPQAFPQQPVFVNLMAIFYKLDLVGKIPGVILAHLMPSLVYAIWINTAAFRSIPPELEEAARMAGADSFTAFFKVTLPLAAPGLLASSVFVFLYSLDEFTGTFFIGLPFVVTLPMLLYSSSGYNMQFASATAIVLMIPSIIFMIIIEKFLKAEYLGGLGG